jgi:hypothetical protein
MKKTRVKKSRDTVPLSFSVLLEKSGQLGQNLSRISTPTSKTAQHKIYQACCIQESIEVKDVTNPLTPFLF